MDCKPGFVPSCTISSSRASSSPSPIVRNTIHKVTFWYPRLFPRETYTEVIQFNRRDKTTQNQNSPHPHLLIPHNPHANRERPHTPPILPQVHVEPARPRHLLQLPLRARHPLHILAPEQGAEHLRQGDLTHLPAQTGVRAQTVMDVALQRPFRVHGFRVWEVSWGTGSRDLCSLFSMVRVS